MLVQGRPVKITYKDNDGDFVDVADDSDLKFALQSSQKLTFLINPEDPIIKMQA